MPIPGVVCIEASSFTTYEEEAAVIHNIIANLETFDLTGTPLIILCDDAEFAAANMDNFLWVTFTRSNPSHDLHGVGAYTKHKHWACKTMVIDARIKPHHAPVLVTDPAIETKVANDLSKL
jgi:4-hydroxy-3-polyprenylbenzoate decarboxylase